MVATNTYNALGQRVRDVTQTNTTDEAYGAGGELLWRYTGSSSDPNQRAFVPFGGGILAEYYSGGTLFDQPDELGSVTASTSYNGAMCQERLFYPYGESWTGAGNCGMQQAFAKLPDYDPEIDQYNTPARHYPAKLGRWLSPDWSATPTPVPYADLADPQSLNLYAYVRNNPTSRTDPDGHRCYDIGGCLGYVTNQLFTSAKKLFGISDTPPPQPPVDSPPKAPPIAELRTVMPKDVSKGTTTFTVYTSESTTVVVTITTRVDVASGAKPGAGDPFSTHAVVGVIHRHDDDKRYGPAGAVIDVGDPRGRHIHGGGGDNPFAPQQGWTKTIGCTRGQNEDVIRLGEAITNFQHNNTLMPILYNRVAEE
jgi:RHS repeat-associated protein